MTDNKEIKDQDKQTLIDLAIQDAEEQKEAMELKDERYDLMIQDLRKIDLNSFATQTEFDAIFKQICSELPKIVYYTHFFPGKKSIQKLDLRNDQTYERATVYTEIVLNEVYELRKQRKQGALLITSFKSGDDPAKRGELVANTLIKI